MVWLPDQTSRPAEKRIYLDRAILEKLHQLAEKVNTNRAARRESRDSTRRERSLVFIFILVCLSRMDERECSGSRASSPLPEIKLVRLQ